MKNASATQKSGKNKRAKEEKTAQVEKHKWSIKEKVLVVMTVLLLLVLIVKSCAFDAYDGKPVIEIDRYMSETYDGTLYEFGILKVRLIEYKETDGNFAVHMRRYLLGILPLGDSYADVKADL